MISGYSQEDLRITEGRITDALFASTTPDKKTIGVFLTVPKKNDVAPQDWAIQMIKYFDAYGLPVKVIVHHKPPIDGTGAHALIFVGGERYKGNLSGGGVGLYHFFEEHEKVFTNLFSLYKQVNSG